MNQKIPKTHSRWLALFLAVSLIGAACGRPPGQGGLVDNFPKGPVILTVWRPFDEATAYQAAAESYRNLHQNVTISYRFIDPSQYETEVVNALASGNGPDIISINHDRVPAFADKLVQMPASFFGGGDLIANLTARYAPAVATDVVFNGKPYAIPFSTDSLALYWNRGMVNQIFNDYIRTNQKFDQNLLLRPPADWNELVEVTKLITQRTGTTITRSGVALGLSSNVPHTADIIAAMMLQRGVSMVTPDLHGAQYHVAAPHDPNFYPGAVVLDYLKSFVDPASDHYTWNVDLPNALDAFIAGNVAMMISDRSVARTIEQHNPTLNFQISPLPQLPNAKTIVDYASYPVEAVTNNSQHTDVAWDFLRHVSTFSTALYTTNSDRTLPIRNQPATTTVLQRTNITSGVFALQAPTAQSWFKGKNADQADALLAAALDRVSRQGQSARDSLNQAAATFTALLQSP